MAPATNTPLVTQSPKSRCGSTRSTGFKVCDLEEDELVPKLRLRTPVSKLRFDEILLLMRLMAFLKRATRQRRAPNQRGHDLDPNKGDLVFRTALRMVQEAKEHPRTREQLKALKEFVSEIDDGFASQYARWIKESR
jgi:hypothetical protein